MFTWGDEGMKSYCVMGIDSVWNGKVPLETNCGNGHTMSLNYRIILSEMQ